MRKPKISKIQRRKISIFLRCIIISFFAWSFFAISSTYIYDQTTNISYVNLPEGKAFHPLQSDMVSVRLELTGWDLMMKRLNMDTTHMQVDLSGLKNRNFVVLSNQIGFIDKQFPSNRKAVSISPDTLFFDFSRQTHKRVEIKPVFALTFKKQFGITGDIKTNPRYVTVTGPSEDVENIDFILTDSIKGLNIDTDVRTLSYLNKNNRTNISFYPSFTEITIPVGEMTEKVIEIPVKVLNTGNFTSVRILPNKVKITFLVSISDYNKWTARDFEAVVDVMDWINHKVTSLPVELKKSPEFTKVVSIEPQNIDFFVRK